MGLGQQADIRVMMHEVSLSSWLSWGDAVRGSPGGLSPRVFMEAVVITSFSGSICCSRAGVWGQKISGLRMPAGGGAEPIAGESNTHVHTRGPDPGSMHHVTRQGLASRLSPYPIQIHRALVVCTLTLSFNGFAVLF